MRSLFGPEEDSALLDELSAEITAALSRDGELEDGPEAAPLEPSRSADPLPDEVAAPLAERILLAAHSVLAQLELSRPRAEAEVARLLALTKRERWASAAADRALHRPEVAELLVEIAETDAERSALDAEELPLLALHITERLDPAAHPHGRVAGLFCQALAVRVEDLIRQRRLAAAELAALRCGELLPATSDPLAAFEVGLASAFVGWATGRCREALQILTRLLELAQALRSAELTAEMATWCYLLLEDRRCPQLARRMRAVADASCGRLRAELLLAVTRAKHDWLRLGEGR